MDDIQAGEMLKHIGYKILIFKLRSIETDTAVKREQWTKGQVKRRTLLVISDSHLPVPGLSLGINVHIASFIVNISGATFSIILHKRCPHYGCTASQ